MYPTGGAESPGPNKILWETVIYLAALRAAPRPAVNGRWNRPQRGCHALRECTSLEQSRQMEPEPVAEPTPAPASERPVRAAAQKAAQKKAEEAEAAAKKKAAGGKASAAGR